MAGRQVATAAAQAAMTVLCDESSCPRDIFDGDDDNLINGLLSPTELNELPRFITFALCF